jgi:hypothetical protein
MKFDCGETAKEWYKRVTDWHDFYAIFPRSVDPHDCRMFETIQRKLVAGEYSSDWVYRKKQN